MKFSLKKEPKGPHNIDILSVLFGGLLGDMYGERRGNASRFQFKQSNKNQEYLHWMHQFLASRGYCSFSKPKQRKLIGKENKVYFYLRGSTYSYRSLNWFVDCFYKQGTKSVPEDSICHMFLTPLALAVWISDDGHKCTNGGILLATDCFTKWDVARLCNVLKNKYQLNCHERYRGIRKDGQCAYAIYIRSNSVAALKKIIGPHIRPSMYYKLS